MLNASPTQSDVLTGTRPENWWTGPRPTQILPPATPQIRVDRASRLDLLKYFDEGWLYTEVLFSALQGEPAFYAPPVHGLRHPLVFYYTHPAVLYVNKLRVAGLLSDAVNPHFERIFEVGVDEMSWDDMSKNTMPWPPIAELTEYRRQVYGLVRNLILKHPALDPQTQDFSKDSAGWALLMGFEHERIHLETSSVLMRELPLHFLRKPEFWPHQDLKITAPRSLPEPLARVDGGEVHLGKNAHEPSFGWDNEYGSRSARVEAFEASRVLVTNGEYLQFVVQGGYRESSFWSEEGWKWRQFRNTKAPAFWVPEGPVGLNQFRLRTIFEEVPFQASWPAIVNFHEAKAFCAWKSLNEKSSLPYRLTSEVEQARLRQEVIPNTEWNLGLRHTSETAVDRYGSNGWHDVFGNVWQWCEDDFNPLPGFEVHPYYEDFSTPCFDGLHQMILGGSFASLGDEAGPYARFHFRPHFVQHAGFRIARSLDPKSDGQAVHLKDANKETSDYESRDLLSQYLLLHFGKESDITPFDFAPKQALRFPQRCAEVIQRWSQKLNLPQQKALDIGCATGGAVFEMTRHFEEVLGIDLSASFISTANQMKARKHLQFDRKDQGELRTHLNVQLDPLAEPDRAYFRHADACSLPADFVDFDAVLMANLLCRLPSPRSCLSRMAGPRGVVKPGGLLVLVSPYSWLEGHTPKSAWLGAQVKNGIPQRSETALHELLSPDFELLEQSEMPLFIREHERKYQYIVSNLKVWRRKF